MRSSDWSSDLWSSDLILDQSVFKATGLQVCWLHCRELTEFGGLNFASFHDFEKSARYIAQFGRDRVRKLKRDIGAYRVWIRLIGTGEVDKPHLGHLRRVDRAERTALISQVSQAFFGIGISPNTEIDDAAVARYLVEPFVRPVRSGDTKLGFPVSSEEHTSEL